MLHKILKIPSEIVEYLSYCPNTGFITRIKTTNGKAIKVNVAGFVNPNGYIQINFKTRDYLGHRLAWFLHYGKQPNQFIDHINGIKNDNRISNLRECTKSQNLMNHKMYKNNQSGCSGVHFDRKSQKYRAEIMANGKYIYLGLFTHLKDAISARKAGEVKYFGEFQYKKAEEKS